MVTFLAKSLILPWYCVQGRLHIIATASWPAEPLITLYSTHVTPTGVGSDYREASLAIHIASWPATRP